ncbi:MAG TPA: 50S ribosomal protein L25 [Candidatus Krumholzibacteria bacterium]|nr:50S ribosomal protein L25 [Candidatus Krumholzibacteria bacterium]HPD72739.1 50S ribosomal protein L25 [Candidatus Krumholzibacteria bacterium]HRY40329.1 50S ribosomal protein L25 [Candidatus Krumholzibacteria bacterium]
MSLVRIQVFRRQTTGKNENRRTRAAGKIPAVLYGRDREPMNVQLDKNEFARVLQKTGGRAVIFDLDLDGESEQPLALMRELQQHPVTDEIHHVDLFEIPRGEPVTVEVNLEVVGEPACVKFGEGEVLQIAHTVEISCLPRELPDSIKVDISAFKLNEKVLAKDLVIPVGKLITDPDAPLVVVRPATIFAEVEAVPAAGEVPAEGAPAEGEEKPEE